MVFIFYAIIGIIVGYLSGSVNYAIIITKLVKGLDIRKIGNNNPGTSNVVRNVGKGWGVLVGFLDGLKGMAPIIIARIFFFSGDTNLDFALLYLIGMAAVIGHCKPVYYKFDGGGGIGTMQGVSLFFIPIEFLVSMFIGGLIVIFFFKKVKFKYGQWTPIMFVTITPFLTLGLNYIVDISLFAHISIGGHPFTVLAGAFAMSFLILFFNISFLGNRAEEYREIK
jgi:acyl phosphate:glycerol-3-phosphate acyltransferase